MFAAYRRGDGVFVRMLCAICQTELPFEHAWLAFRPPEDRGSPALWVHRACIDGRAEQIYGAPHVTLWRGEAAFQGLVQGWKGHRAAR